MNKQVSPIPALTLSAPEAPAQKLPVQTNAGRDLRLDFFRGLAMFIIFIAHTPRDPWALWIPARFGFSDATETFVFCSGMASALAFGSIFLKHGWWMGAARVVYRTWQVYWAHIGLFFAVLLLMTMLDRAGNFAPDPGYSYVSSLNLQHFYQKTPELIVGLFSLTYVPNYFDILPMYLVILAMIPIVMGLARVSLWAVLAFVVGVWLLANLDLFGLPPVNFPAEPWSDRKWFFNPLGWQLVFFTGFAFMRGWIKPPEVSRGRICAAIFIVVATLPFAWFRIYDAYPDWLLYSDATPWFKQQRELLAPVIGKTRFGLFRYIHFLATAYLAWVLVGPQGVHLNSTGMAQPLVHVIRKVGQQSLAVFVSSLVIAQLVGVIFKLYGTGWPIAAMGNLSGFAGLVAVAYCVAWFKSQPWRKPATPVPQSVANLPAKAGGATLSPDGIPARKID